MIFLYTLKRYTKGVRLFSAVLAVMMFVSLWMGVKACAEFYYDISDLLVFQSADPTNAYYMQIFPDSASFAEDLDIKAAEKAITAFKEHPKVEKAFGIKNVNPLSFNGSSISIALYDPQMLEFFPGLKRLGINFSKNSDGVILGSSLFADLGNAKEVEINYNYHVQKETAILPIAGYVSSPYRKIQFGTASTGMTASGLFGNGDIIIMQETEATMAKLNFSLLQTSYAPNFVVVFKDDVSVEEQHRVMSEIAPHHSWVSFDDISENTNQSIGAMLKEELPQPIFYMVVSVVAYLSCVILTLKKKQKELAVYRMLGHSQRESARLAFTSVTITAVVPVILCTALVLILPHVDLSHERLVALHDTKRIGDSLFYTLLGYANCRFGPVCLLIVVLYYAITVLIALSVTVGSMRKNSPLTYLRGASQ